MSKLKNHSIAVFAGYGELTLHGVPSFAEYTLRQLFDEAGPILNATLHAIKEIEQTDFSIYTASHAAKLRDERLREERTKLHAVLRKFMAQTKANIDRVTEKIKSCSKPTQLGNLSQQLTYDLRQAEIRGLLRQKTLQEIKTILENDIESGNGEFIVAVSNSPDRLIPDDLLYRYQRGLAFKQNPELESYEHQVRQLSEIVREKSAQLNASQIVMLKKNRFNDPITKEQHFETFQPRNPHEEELAKQLINSERHKRRIEEQMEQFDKGKNAVTVDRGVGDETSK